MWPKFPKHVFFVTSPPEVPPPQTKNFFSILTTRFAESVDGLDSSLAQSAAELWLAKVCPERANHAFSEKF